MRYASVYLNQIGVAQVTDKNHVELKLSNRPDEYGFLYGRLKHGDEEYSVNVMPPKMSWSGGQTLDGFEPHDTDWVLYLDGKEFARVQQKDEIEIQYKQKLLM